MLPELNFDQEHLLKLARMKMPFGKYKGWVLADLPEPYLLWFSKQGFPNGELGKLLALMLELQINGLEALLDPLKAKELLKTKESLKSKNLLNTKR